MHRLKNKKLLSLFLAGMIATVSMSIQYVYAEDELNNNTEQEIVTEEVKNIVVNDINNIDNLNFKVKTQGTITKIDGSSIYIKDDSGEGIVFLDNIVLDTIKEGDVLEVTGMVVELEGKNVISVDNIENINITISEEQQETEEDTNMPEDDMEENNTPVTNPEEDENNNKPTDSNSSSNSKLPNSKPSGSTLNNSTQESEIKGTDFSSETIVSNNVAGKGVRTISSDLTESQWDKVKTALEEGNIKVKDLPNNKIRITKVSSEKGDTIWIVNDPRMLDSEEEEVDIVNSKSIIIINSINHEEYDVTESKWSDIVDDIIDGNAKIKLLSNQDLKVIYTKSSGEDSTIRLSKI